MDRIWQWAWDRYGPKYSWAMFVFAFVTSFPVYLLASLFVVAFEGSHRYAEAAVITAVTQLVSVYIQLLPGSGQIRLAERWAAGEKIDRATALDDTYRYVRTAAVRAVLTGGAFVGILLVMVAAVTGTTGVRLLQYAILGAAYGIATVLIALHSIVEAMLRPVRAALTKGANFGDSLPRSRPTFAAWASLSVVAVACYFALVGAMFGALFHQASHGPVVLVAIAIALTVVLAVPLTVAVVFAPSMQPMRDLAEGTHRVAGGNYSQRLPVVQDDDLGALAASFNRMQAGLAERQRLQAAFGTYVDPILASRLLEQGDDVFTGERREVTVMFVDIRDFTPFAETNQAEEVVARLNALFEIVVPAVVDAGGHVNKFLGDGSLAVFGAPNDLADHADAAVSAAVVIQRLLAERFGDDLRIGIGINTGVVIAGTIGSGGKLEFTLIGDAVNVAARVEQLTKTTGDTILLTRQTLDALDHRPVSLVDRGSHALKGKSAATQVVGLASA
jgi:adenylate cyclase